MILVDANLLVYAYHSGSPFHDQAKSWLEEVLSGLEPVGLPWSTLHAFLRLTTNPKIVGNPFPIDEAAGIVEEWLQRPQVVVPQPGDRYWPILRRLLEEARVQGSLVTDAHLAALAVEHGAALYSSDRDFRRFNLPDLVDPLASPE